WWDKIQPLRIRARTQERQQHDQPPVSHRRSSTGPRCYLSERQQTPGHSKPWVFTSITAERHALNGVRSTSEPPKTASLAIGWPTDCRAPLVPPIVNARL